jgi:hypothetical protein
VIHDSSEDECLSCEKRLLFVRRLLLLIVLVTLSGLEPLDELLGALANLLAGRQVDVLLAGLGAPSLEGLLGNKVVLVVLKQDGRDLRDEVRLLHTDETLETTEESLLVLLGRDHTLEHAAAGLDLLDDVLVEDGLSKNGDSLVLGLDTEFLGLEVDLDIVKLRDTTLGLTLRKDPLAKLVVGVTLCVLVLGALDDESALEVGRQISGTSLDGFLGHIDFPFDLLLLLDLVKLLCLSVNAASELIITAGVESEITIIIVLVGAAVVAAVTILDSSAVALSLLSGFALGLLGGLVLLALGRELLQDEGRQLLARVRLGDGTASLAVHENALILDANNSFGILATSAEDELVDETVEVILQLRSLVGSVDDPAVILGVVGGLGTEFETEVLDDV